MTRLQWAILIVVTAVLGGGWTWLSRVPEGLDDVPSPVAGRSAPDFTLRTVDGQSFTLSDLRGQVVILNFWATWCPPCREEMPALQEVYDARRAEGLMVLAVNQDEADASPDVVRTFGSDMGLTFPLLLDPGFTVGFQYRVDALPSTFFIDRAGVIRDVRYGGPMSRAFIESQIAPLLEAR